MRRIYFSLIVAMPVDTIGCENLNCVNGYCANVGGQGASCFCSEGWSVDTCELGMYNFYILKIFNLVF